MLCRERLEELGRLSGGKDGEIVNADALAEWGPDEIADAEGAGVLVFRGYGDSARCHGCHKGCPVEPKRVKYPDGRNVGVWICRDSEGGGRIEFEMDRLRQWEIVGEKLRELGCGAPEAEVEEGGGKRKSRKTKFEKIAAIAAYLQVNPMALSKEVSAATGIDESDVRRLWGPIRRAMKEGKSPLPGGYKNEGTIEAADRSASCKYCREPLGGSFDCRECGDIIVGECKTCHFTQLHPDKAEP